jgi:hypothetical protein
MTSTSRNRHTYDLASTVQTPNSPEVAMSTTLTPLDRIDTDIELAAVALGVARSSFSRCPSAENARALDDAVAAVDRLLDERLAAGRS